MEFKLDLADDRERFDRLGADLTELASNAAVAGLFDPGEATKGYRHETGQGVPRRPWMSAGADAVASRAGDTATKQLRAVVGGSKRSPAEATKALAELFAKALRDLLSSGQAPGPAIDSAASGDARPLVDSGDMLRAIEARVVPSKGGAK